MKKDPVNRSASGKEIMFREKAQALDAHEATRLPGRAGPGETRNGQSESRMLALQKEFADNPIPAEAVVMIDEPELVAESGRQAYAQSS